MFFKCLNVPVIIQSNHHWTFVICLIFCFLTQNNWICVTLTNLNQDCLIPYIFCELQLDQKCPLVVKQWFCQRSACLLGLIQSFVYNCMQVVVERAWSSSAEQRGPEYFVPKKRPSCPGQRAVWQSQGPSRRWSRPRFVGVQVLDKLQVL